MVFGFLEVPKDIADVTALSMSDRHNIAVETDFQREGGGGAGGSRAFQ